MLHIHSKIYKILNQSKCLTHSRCSNPLFFKGLDKRNYNFYFLKIIPIKILTNIIILLIIISVNFEKI